MGAFDVMSDESEGLNGASAAGTPGASIGGAVS